MSGDDTTINTRGLDQLIKALKVKVPIARIGILGSKGQRDGKGPSNAEVGAAHEFGTEHLPIRSFLRVPISEHLNAKMENSRALDEDVLKEVIKSGTVVPWLRKVAALAKGIVDDAFNTGGFGKWKPSNMDHKKTKQTLVETHQLRDSIDWDVKE